jgi:hypothetical protein
VLEKASTFFLTSEAKMKKACCRALHDVVERGSSFKLCVRGVFGRYNKHYFMIKDRFWIVLWRLGGIRKREINVFGVLLILYNLTYAILLLVWKEEERREAIKL